jgi:hypothetical protein
VFLVYLAYTIRHFTLHDGRQRSGRHYSNLSVSTLFILVTVSHLKNVMENFNYGFFFAICKEGARNYFLLLQTCITLSLRVEIMLVKLNMQHPECLI